MAKLTIGFGILLIIVGVVGFVGTGSAHPTALIPSAMGILFIIFGAFASSDNVKKRMLWMHISVTVALLLFLSLIKADIDVIRLSRGAFYAYPSAVIEKSLTSLLSLLYVLFCVRSFIAARRQRRLNPSA
ncbi:MAG TPA: hypothetical protein VFE38_15155 [Edaphobacter sp.]|nr:hypothetical protein [Edaphobacter sp.]